MKKIFTLVSGAALVGAFIIGLSSPAFAPNYRMMDGTRFFMNIPGEGMINQNTPPLTTIVHWAWGTPESAADQESYAAGTFGPRAPGKGPGSLTLTKRMDATSGLLQQTFEDQTTISGMIVAPAIDSPRSNYNDYQLSDVKISAYSRSGEGKDETETISFSYSVIHWSRSPRTD